MVTFFLVLWINNEISVYFNLSYVVFQRDCLNYIRVLQVVDDERLYVCGTHAFQPQCDYLVGQCSIPQINRCSGSPFNRNLISNSFRTSLTSRWAVDLKTAGGSAPSTRLKALRPSWLVSWGQFYVISQRALLVFSPAVKCIIIPNNLLLCSGGKMDFLDNKLIFVLFAVFLSDGELYSGTAYNFLGSEPIISRYSPSQSLLRTEYSTSWLNGESGQYINKVMLCLVVSGLGI